MEIIPGVSVDGYRIGDSRAKVRILGKGEWSQAERENRRLDKEDGTMSLLFADGKLYCIVIFELSRRGPIKIGGKSLGRFNQLEVKRFFDEELNCKAEDTPKGFGSSTVGLYFYGDEGGQFKTLEVH